jgi:hypothetical protein
VVTPPAKLSSDTSYVYLVLQGRGVAWFDLLSLTYSSPLPGARPGAAPRPDGGAGLAGGSDHGRGRKTDDAAGTNKCAIFWRGDYVAFNATAASNVRSRGFTHAIVPAMDQARWLCVHGLRPILSVDVGSLRSYSPFAQAAELQAANASLLRLLQGAPACLAGNHGGKVFSPRPLYLYE